MAGWRWSLYHGGRAYIDLKGGVGLAEAQAWLAASGAVELCLARKPLGVLPRVGGGPLGTHCGGCHAWRAAGSSADQSGQLETTDDFCLATAQR